MATDEQQAKAKEMGWISREQFHGDPNDFIDADEFVSRGEKLMPILKANNRKLTAEVQRLRSENQESRQRLTQAEEAISEFRKQGAQGRVNRLKAEKQRVLAEKTAAIQAEDAAGQTQADDRLTQLNSEISEAEKAVGAATSTKTQPPAQSDQAANQAAFNTWLAANPWYGKDARKTRYANGVAQELRADQANADLVGQPFYEKVSEEIAREFPTKRQAGKLEPGGNGSGGGSGGSEGDHSYSDLPAEAKSVCDKNAKNPRYVGADKMFKTPEDYKRHYVQHYDWS